MHQKTDLTLHIIGAAGTGLSPLPWSLWINSTNSIGRQQSSTTGKQYLVVESLLEQHGEPIEGYPVIEQMLQKAKTFSKIKADLESIELAMENWLYEFPRPSSGAVDEVAALLDRLRANEVLPFRVTPSAVGGIGICLKNKDKYADFECDNDGNITALMSDGKGDIKAVTVNPTFEGRNLVIRELKGFLGL